MQVTTEEILHIAQLANLNLKQEEVEVYKGHLQEILNYANIVNNANLQGLEETIGINDAYNVFRKDEVCQTSTRDELMQNATEKQDGMFKIPKVIN